MALAFVPEYNSGSFIPGRKATLGASGQNVLAICLMKYMLHISELLSVGLKSITATAVGHTVLRDSEQYHVAAPSACLCIDSRKVLLTKAINGGNGVCTWE